MQILKIDSTNFKSKNIIPIKNISSKITKTELYSKMPALAATSALGIASIALNKKDEKSYEKTLEENFFKLPPEAQPDIFQKASAAYLYNGNDVLVTAPTGTGKTAIANYVITKNLEEGKKTFYTTPLKALSNEKFRNFQKIYGEENVGLITGDTKINKDAPIVIMTTEVYRNMIFSEQFKEHNPVLDDLKTVIFDELHYLGDVDRGGIWEQSIIFSDFNTQLLSLSATIGNNTEIARWMAECRDLKYFSPKISTEKNHISDFNSVMRTPKDAVGLINVPSENRHVPLEFNNIQILGQAFLSAKKKRMLVQKDSKTEIKKPQNPTSEDYKSMVEKLQNENKVPAIFFIFSKKGCKKTLDYLTQYGPKLNSKKEIEEIKEILGRYKSENKYLGETLNLKALEKGYAIHNSGLLPTQKELIEELFQKKLVKVVLATETLSAGINMPAKTTVISSYMKPDAKSITGFRELTPNEFHQMAGRAGRRGIDTIGYCYTMSLDQEQKEVFDKLIASEPNELKSAFEHPDYSFVANYYEITDNDDLIKEIAKRSFYTYDRNESAAFSKQKTFLKNFGIKRKILRKFDFIDSGHQLNAKGKLLTKLNGYEQIPIINAIDSKRLGGMNPVELAAAVGTLANIQIKIESDKKTMQKENTPFKHENNVIEYFVAAESNKLNQYNTELTKMNPWYQTVEFNKDVASHIYAWANSNNIDENSIENWTNMIKKQDQAHPIEDEGTLFKEITLTIDLLKQITEICDMGVEIASNELEKNYYTELKDTAQESIKLLSQKPVV